MITLHDCIQGSEKWASLRENLYTGSNADKLLKFGKIDYALSHLNSFRGNRWTERGHLLEPEAIELYEKITGIDVLTTGLVTNDKYPDAAYSPDGLLPDTLIEVKCFDEPNHMELINAKPDELPLKILAQIYFGMVVCELNKGKLIAYNPKMKEVKDRLKIIEIKPKRAITSNFKRIMLGGRT
jgi:hypothetical protein